MTQQLVPGQHIKTNRFLFAHHGIFMGNHAGRPCVAELAKPAHGGVKRLLPLESFSKGAPVEVVNHANGLPYEQVVRNVWMANQWRRYDLLGWNCEHFATWCATHHARSDQVKGVSMFIAAAVCVLIVGQLAA